MTLTNQITTDAKTTEKETWESPSVKEAAVGAITESVGLGNNDGAASHS